MFYWAATIDNESLEIQSVSFSYVWKSAIRVWRWFLYDGLLEPDIIFWRVQVIAGKIVSKYPDKNINTRWKTYIKTYGSKNYA